MSTWTSWLLGEDGKKEAKDDGSPPTASSTEGEKKEENTTEEDAWTKRLESKIDQNKQTKVIQYSIYNDTSL